MEAEEQEQTGPLCFAETPPSLPQSSSPSPKLKVPRRKKRKKQATPPSSYQVLCKERQEKECFTCEKKACTSCRKTPQEIFQTRQALWAKAKQEEERLRETIRQEARGLLLKQDADTSHRDPGQPSQGR